MSPTCQSYQRTANFVVGHCQRKEHFGARDFAANHVVKNTMQVIQEQEEDLAKEEGVQEEVGGEEDLLS